MEKFTLKDLLKGSKWKEFFKELTKKPIEEDESFWQKCINEYHKEMEEHKEKVNQEILSLNKMNINELLQKIAKTLIEIRENLNR